MKAIIAVAFVAVILPCVLSDGLGVSYDVGPDGSVKGGYNYARTNNFASEGSNGRLAISNPVAIGGTFSKRPGQYGQQARTENIGLDISMNKPVQGK